MSSDDDDVPAVQWCLDCEPAELVADEDEDDKEKEEQTQEKPKSVDDEKKVRIEKMLC